MKLQMQAIRFDADARLKSFIQQKLNKLDTFYDRIISGEVFLKLDKSESNKIQTKFLDVKLNLPGGSVFVSEKGTTFEEATDLAVETLKMRIKRFKDKRNEVRSTRPTIEDEGIEYDDFDLEEVA